MNLFKQNIRTQKVSRQFEHGVELYIKREDEIHPYVSGNKFRKLKYNLEEAKNLEKKTLVTFGGAYSNHIAAVAVAGKEFGFETIGFIRGEELNLNHDQNPTLSYANLCGMSLKFVTRDSYRNKKEPQWINKQDIDLDNSYIIPEGGTNALAVKGCEEILTEDDSIFDVICCSVGTGGTLSGLINSKLPEQKVLGFPALKGSFLKKEILKFASKSEWQLITDYHFGGYAKTSDDLILFINNFKSETAIPLDPIYTGKMMYGICDLIDSGFFPKNTKILAIHTGGLQGIEGMNLRLRQQNRPLIV